jgi:hypothetical protein
LESIDEFAKAVLHLRNLTALSIDLYGCETLQWAYVLGQSMAAFPPLTSLHLDFRCCSSLLSISDIFVGVGTLRELRELKLDMELCALNFSGFAGITELEESVQRLDKLESLSLRFGGWRMLARIDGLGRSLAALSDLRSLTLDFHGCSRLQSVAEVGASLRQLENLAQVRMGFKYCMELATVAPLAEGVSWLKELNDFAVDFSSSASLPRVLQCEFDSREEFVVTSGVCSLEELEQRLYVPPKDLDDEVLEATDVIPGQEKTCWLLRTETRKAEGCPPNRVCTSCYLYRYWCRFCNNPKCRVYTDSWSGDEMDMRCQKRLNLGWGVFVNK